MQVCALPCVAAKPAVTSALKVLEEVGGGGGLEGGGGWEKEPNQWMSSQIVGKSVLQYVQFKYSSDFNAGYVGLLLLIIDILNPN